MPHGGFSCWWLLNVMVWTQSVVQTVSKLNLLYIQVVDFQYIFTNYILII